MWTCQKCGENIDDTADVCRNCGTSKAGVEDSAFQRDEDAPGVKRSIDFNQPFGEKVSPYVRPKSLTQPAGFTSPNHTRVPIRPRPQTTNRAQLMLPRTPLVPHLIIRRPHRIVQELLATNTAPKHTTQSARRTRLPSQSPPDVSEPRNRDSKSSR